VRRKGQREELQSLEGAQKAHLSKKLVTIQTDLELPPVRCAHSPPLQCSLCAVSHSSVYCCRVAWEELRLQPPRQEQLPGIERALGELEFRHHLQRLNRVWEGMRSAAALQLGGMSHRAEGTSQYITEGS
jgi:hypothetical protein